jgi:hypothetical protein
MVRAGILTVVVGLLVHAAAAAQTAAWQFRSRPGQTISYRVEQVTSATEVIGGNQTATRTKLNLVKRWKNLGAEAGKPGTKFVLSLAALRIETSKADGGVLLFDSDDLARSTPELRKELEKFVGPPLAVLRLDATGKVHEVVESKFGPASRYESELPFVFLLPGGTAQVGQTWQRAYQVTLAPPQGTGEKYDAVQKYECKGIRDGKATVGLTTVIKKMPESPLDRVPLLQVQPEGEVVFDIKAGRLHSATLKIDRQLKGHQGPGSSYHFESVYKEQYQEDR